MTNCAESAKLNWPRWAQVLLIALLVVIVCNRSASLLDSAAYRAGLYGELVYAGGRAVNDPAAPPGFGKMVDVVPEGPFARAGVRNGDHVRPDPVYFRQQNLGFARTLNFSLDRDGVRSERQITLERVPADSVEAQGSFRRLVNLLAAFVSMLIGCFIMWRGWGNKTAMLLGAALLMLGRGGSGIPGWADQFLAFPMWWILLVGGTTSALLVPFAFRMFEASAGKLPRWHWYLATVWIVLAALAQAFAASDLFALTNYVVGAGASGLPSLLGAISCLVSIAYLAGGWTKAAAAERTRFALTIFSLTAYAFASLVAGWDASRTGQLFAFGGQEWLVYFNALMLGVIAPGLLAYAVLRHKLFDLGFAVNRTLVYGTVSAVLLVGIGLTEYAVKSLVPKVWTQGSVFISAGIAVGVFLIFHRIHHSVEHAIERLFFHKWQVNEATLKRFVTAAAHVEKPEALAGQFENELTRFSGGAGATLYTRSGDGAYASATGETINADDPALSAMRAEQGPVVPTEVHSALPAALTLPMMHQAALAGFALLGPKPTGEDYRPDEVEVLGWATQQVGLDLQAIRVRELEQSVTKLEARNANLSDVLAKAAIAKA